MKFSIVSLACLFLVAGLFCSTRSYAQSLSSDDIRSQLIKEWERAKVYTISYMNTMPSDKYSFKVIDSLRSFAQQLLHLAAANVFLMSKAGMKEAPAFGNSDIEHSPTAQSKDSVFYYVVTSYDYCIEVIRNTPTNKWGEVIDLFGFKESRFALILKSFEHQTHHRAQTTVYIRLQNIIPPNEKLF
ncbi:MAG: DinB family protein [Chitinophagales bacterium]